MQKQSLMHPNKSARIAATVAALGVVFGDIGTSPLYTLQSVFSLEHGAIAPTPEHIYGIVSTIVWALIIIVTVKYVRFVMSADNGGEGGILALTELVYRSIKNHKPWALALGIVGASLFYGDSVITPAVSVMSAIEGVGVVNPHLNHLVVPLGATILIVLFVAQRFGTAVVARAFGPVMVAWFIILAALGVAQIVIHPAIFLALSPTYAVSFIVHSPGLAFLSFGSVVLAVTGAEALYADIGHFGRTPIRSAWLLLVLPSLLLNYLGQAAMLVAHPEHISNPFFLMAPKWATIPLVVVSTLATVIAAQAVITGAYSVSKQAQSLGLLPRLTIKQTSHKERGQIYIPAVNWLLFAGVMTLLLVFQSSARLATAYGLAVTGTFLLTTSLFTWYAATVRHWKKWQLVLFAAGLGSIELALFSANAIKLFLGGWIPLTIGTVLVFTMVTWRHGLRMLFNRRNEITPGWDEFIAGLREKNVATVPGTALYLHLNQETPPAALETNVRFNHVLHENIIVIRVITTSWPRVLRSQRVTVDTICNDPHITRLTLNYGFFETPDIAAAIPLIRKQGVRVDEKPFYYTGRLSLVPGDNTEMMTWRKKVFFFLYHNQAQPISYFRLPPKRTIDYNSRLVL